MYEQKPWLKYYRAVPVSIDYPRITMYESVMRSAERNPNAIAYDFRGYTSTYRQMAREIDHCANALALLG